MHRPISTPALLILISLLPRTAVAQDLSGLAILTLPAVMLTPVIMAFALRALLCPRQEPCPGVVPFVLVAIIETLLWTLCLALVIIAYFNERWGATLAGLAITAGICWLLNGRLASTAGQRGFLMLLPILLVPLVLVLLLAVSYLLAILFHG